MADEEIAEAATAAATKTARLRKSLFPNCIFSLSSKPTEVYQRVSRRHVEDCIMDDTADNEILRQRIENCYRCEAPSIGLELAATDFAENH
jgi:hypothetical protein